MRDPVNPYSSPESEEATPKLEGAWRNSWAGWASLAWCMVFAGAVLNLRLASEHGTRQISLLDYLLIGLLFALGLTLGGFALLQPRVLTRFQAIVSIAFLSYTLFSLFIAR